MTVDVLPPSYTFGKVVGRVIQAIADTAEDVDALPQARAAAGTVTFTPAEVLRKVADDGTGTGAFVTAGPTPANLSSSGRILDAEGRQGIWLVTGTYTVSFNLTDRSMKINPFTIAVTADHTDDAPLDLAVAAPPDPPSNVTLVVYTLPAGGTAGQVMTKTSSGSAYLDPAAPDLSGYATTTALTAGLSGKANTATVATTATTSGALVAGKHTPVDATSGVKTMALPTSAAAGVLISVEKTDASANAVAVTGTLRGAAASSIPLTSQYEVRTFLSEGSGSWRPISDHRTAASLSATFDALGAATAVQVANRLALARNPDQLISGAITRDANGAATSAPVTWPDGSPGTYTADTVSSAFPGAVDAYHITYGSPVTKTYTQPAVTRDSTSGAVTNAPAVTVA